MRNLNKNARAITRVGLTTTGATMLHALEHSQSITYHLMRLASFYVSDKTYTAGIFFKGGMV